MVGGRWPSMVRNGPSVGTVWARCGHGGYAYLAGVPDPRIPAGAGWVAPAVGCPRCLAPVSGTPTLSLACRAELQDVGPAPLRTVSGRASRRMRRRHVLGRGDVRDAGSPGTSVGMAPGQGVGDPQKRVAMRRQVHVAKRLRSGEAAEFLDEHLTVALIAPLAGLDDQSLHSAVEKSPATLGRADAAGGVRPTAPEGRLPPCRQRRDNCSVAGEPKVRRASR